MAGPFVTPLPGVPHVESPFFEQIFGSLDVDPETLRVARDLHEQGFAVIQFPEADLDALTARIRADLQPRYDWTTWREHGWASGGGLRLQDAWIFNHDVRRIAANQQVLALLETLYGRKPFPFQTLNFPVGTQQPFHSDSVHFSSVPERFMCGVWVAFEDVDEDNGPLVYYPGSHKLPIYTNEQLGLVRPDGSTEQRWENYHRFEAMWRALVSSADLKEQRFFAHKGQALIWSANLLHGGDQQQDPARTRWSQVTHYYFEDCAYFTPMLSDPFLGRISFRDATTDVASGRLVPNRYGRRPLPAGVIAATRTEPKGLFWPYSELGRQRLLRWYDGHREHPLARLAASALGHILAARWTRRLMGYR